MQCFWSHITRFKNLLIDLMIMIKRSSFKCEIDEKHSIKVIFFSNFNLDVQSENFSARCALLELISQFSLSACWTLRAKEHDHLFILSSDSLYLRAFSKKRSESLKDIQWHLALWDNSESMSIVSSSSCTATLSF